MSDNWHEDSTDYIWHALRTNKWEASATLPDGWDSFTPPPTVLLPQE